MKVQMILLACCGLALNVLGADNFWTLDSTEQANWTSANWSLGEKPSSANPARIPQNAGTAAKWKNANILVDTFEQPGNFTLGGKQYSSNRLEIAKGGVICNTSMSACAAKDTWAELVFNGGVLTNDSGTAQTFFGVLSGGGNSTHVTIEMNDGEWVCGRMHVGYRAPATLKMTGGRIVSTYNGFFVGQDNDNLGLQSEWIQSGGTVIAPVVTFGKGCMRMSGGTIETTGQFTTGDSVDFTGTGGTIKGGMSMDGDAYVKDMSLDLTGMTIGNSTVSPSRNRKVVFDGSTVLASGDSTIYGSWLVVTNSEVSFPSKKLTFRSYVSSDYKSVMTSTLEVASGSLTCGALYLNDQPQNRQLGPVIIRQTGGKVTVDTLYYSCTLRPEMYFLYEISGGTNVLSGGIGANHTSATNGILIRVIGNRGKFTYNYPIPQGADNIMPPFFEHVIADGEISQTRQTGSYNAYWYSMCALRPQGGLQMTTNTVYDQFYKYPKSDVSYAVYLDRCRWGEGLFTTNGTGTAETIGTTVAAKWAFDPAADITSAMTAADGGFTSAAGVPWGWYDLPPVRTNTLKRALVCLTLEPKAKTFAELEDGFREAGYKVAAADAATGQVTLELPIGRLGNKATDRRLFFDFTEYRTPRDIYEGRRTTNAVVKAVSYTQEKLGLILMVR